jgi:hypothetical protein
VREELVSRKFGLTEINDAMRALGADEVDGASSSTD